MPEAEAAVEATAEAVAAAEATEAVVEVATPQAGTRQGEASLLGVVGAIYSAIRITLLPPSVKNIIYLGNLLIDVRSQHHARGRTSSFQKINEILTSLRPMTT